MSVLTQWEYPFLFVVIGLREACDTVVVIEKKEEKLVRVLLEKIFLLHKKRDT